MGICFINVMIGDTGKITRMITTYYDNCCLL